MTSEEVLTSSSKVNTDTSIDALNTPENISKAIKNALESSTIRVNNPFGYRFVKRFADIVLSLMAIICLSPLLLIVALLIYLDDKGSPIFSQVRFTENGKSFRMYKFRSMCMNAEERLKEVQHMNESKDGVIFKIKDDPRITKIGKFIRKTSIDELPQLFNILMGDMSIVGPRPPIAREVVQYTSYQMNRFLVKGGLTCFWQCSGRSNIGFEEQVEMDIKYIETRSLWIDIKMILKTIKTVLKMEGAS